jgi:hypothetical protein
MNASVMESCCMASRVDNQITTVKELSHVGCAISPVDAERRRPKDAPEACRVARIAASVTSSTNTCGARSAMPATGCRLASNQCDGGAIAVPDEDRLGASSRSSSSGSTSSASSWKDEAGVPRYQAAQATSTTIAAPVSPAAQPVNRPRPPPRSSSA